MRISIATFLVLAFSMFGLSASEHFNGQFDLANSKYTVNFKYSLALNEVASNKDILFFDEFTIPESNDTIPAYCYFTLQFPFTYLLEITDGNSKKVVYSKNGKNLINTSSSGGFVRDGNCFWNIFDWKKDLNSAHIRITDKDILLDGKAYRFTLDTHLIITSLGVMPNDIMAVKSLAKKNSDGIGDGEVWLDTMPDLKGDYQRTYFRIYK